jgi:mono/diheme cytochrome c family protein
VSKQALTYHMGMKHIFTSRCLLNLLLMALVCSPLAAQVAIVKTGTATGSASSAGGELFRQYCAVCHGSDAKGDGPVAGALRKRPADLTLLSRKSGGKFPELRVMNFIKGDDAIMAHGTREMPMWGRMFSDLSGGRPETVQIRIYALLKYLETIQTR